MRVCTIGLLSSAVFGLAAPAHAATYPVATLIGGEVQQAVVSNQCYVVRGSSEFQRNGGANTAFVTVSEMVAAGYALNGHIGLVFTTAASGTAHFPFSGAYPPNFQVVAFHGYSQTYAPATKGFVAKFILDFPGCALPVLATYNSP
jgi:hypothetical protein